MRGESPNVFLQQNAKKANLFSVGTARRTRRNSICFFTKRGRSKDDDYERTLATDGDFARIVDSAQ